MNEISGFLVVGSMDQKIHQIRRSDKISEAEKTYQWIYDWTTNTRLHKTRDVQWEELERQKQTEQTQPLGCRAEVKGKISCHLEDALRMPLLRTFFVEGETKNMKKEPQANSYCKDSKSISTIIPQDTQEYLR